MTPTKALAVLALSAAMALPRLATGGVTAAKPEPGASIQEIMRVLVDPAADSLWDSVSTTSSIAGIEEKRPATPAQWEEQRRHALRLIEGANLLLVRGRPVVAAGRTVEDAQLAAVLAPAAIDARIAADPARFAQRAKVLKVAALAALKATQARDAQQLMQAGAALDEACEQCHLAYWYPNGGPPAASRSLPH